MPSLLAQVATLLLGLLTGAMLLIGASLVPYWSSLEPLEFSRWFAANAPFIGRVMVPLGSAATLAVFLAAVVASALRVAGWPWLALAAVSALFVVVIYPLYYTSANAALASGKLTSVEVTAELSRWRFWHWARIFAGAVAFLAAIRACSLQARSPAA